MIKPLNGYVLIKPIKADEKTKGGIYIPDTADKEKPMEGEVVAMPDVNMNQHGNHMPMELVVGDKVLFGRYSGEDLTYEKEEYKIVELQFIRAKLT